MAQVLNYARVKHLFFDDKKIVKKTERAERAVLSRFGAFVMTTAKRSIRAPRRENIIGRDGKPLRGKDGKLLKRRLPSRPGEPPRNVTGIYKRSIFFGFDAVRRSVVIGGTQGKSGAAETLEHGGKVRVRRGDDTHTIFVEPRPAMALAFAKESDAHLPEMFRGAIV